MPRFAPRLLRRLQAASSKSSLPLNQPQPKLRRQSKPPPPCPPLSPKGRKQSIILDSLRPIMAISHSRRHKEPPPPLRMTRRQIRYDGRQPTYRVMSEEERALWASPYLRMLSTPIRYSVVGSRLMPSALLIRLSAKRVQGPERPTVTVVPDRIEHPAYRRPRRPGFGQYLDCRRDALLVTMDRKLHRRSHDSAMLHPGLEAQVTHLLRVRALQELQMLVRCLKRRPRRATEAPLLRRLTRAEWKKLKAAGTIPQEDAVAVIVVPPLNRDPTTKARPEPSMASLPLEGVTMTRKDARPLPPVSTLMPISSDWFEEDAPSLILPRSKVPLYNGLALFPSPEQRAACHKLLTGLLHLERRARLKERIRVTERQSQSEAASEELQPAPKPAKRPRGDEKGSHAFLLRSNAKTLLRADTVPLAIALWRIRLWEGEGWDLAGSPEYVGPWAAH